MKTLIRIGIDLTTASVVKTLKAVYYYLHICPSFAKSIFHFPEDEMYIDENYKSLDIVFVFIGQN